MKVKLQITVHTGDDEVPVFPIHDTVEYSELPRAAFAEISVHGTDRLAKVDHMFWASHPHEVGYEVCICATLNCQDVRHSSRFAIELKKAGWNN